MTSRLDAGVRNGLMLGMLAALLWGGFQAASRHGIGAGLTPADMTFLRFAAAGSMLLPVLLRRSHRLKLREIGWRRACLLTLLAGPAYVLIAAAGYQFAPLAHGAVIQLGSLSMAAVVLGVLLLNETLGKRRIVGLAVLLLGLLMVAGPALLVGGSRTWIGDVLFAVSGAMFALYSTLVRRWQIDGVLATALVAVLSAALFVPGYLMSHDVSRLASFPISMLALQALVQGVLSGVISLLAYAKAIELLGSGRAALFPAMAPMVAVLLGLPLLGEAPTWFQWLGLSTATVGLVAALRQPPSSVKAG